MNESGTRKLVDSIVFIQNADLSGIRFWSNELIISYLEGSHDEDNLKRDAHVWADVIREMKRRNINMTIDESKFDFW